MTDIYWPLQRNVIRGRSDRNTFGLVRRYETGAPKPHQGWDFEAPLQTPVYAVAAGEVAFVRNRGAYGLQLCIEFEVAGRTLFAFYAHLSKVHVSEGAQVSGNELVAASGESGNAAGMPAADQHVHFEIRTAKHPRSGLLDRISPLTVFGKCPLHEAIPG